MNTKFLIKSEVFNISYSDHSLILSVFDHLVSLNKPSRINSRCFNDKKIISLKQIFLSILSISNFDRYSDVNSRWAAIKALLISWINIAAPNKNMHVKTRNLVPWFDNELVNLSKKKNQVYNKAIRSKLDKGLISKHIDNPFLIYFVNKNLLPSKILLLVNLLLVKNIGRN
jgi:hypothetical protein